MQTDNSVAIDVILNFAPTESKSDTPLHAAIESAVKQLCPGTGLIASVETAFTDSHVFREKGVTAYGFGPFSLKQGDLAHVHGNDERIPVEGFTGAFD